MSRFTKVVAASVCALVLALVTPVGAQAPGTVSGTVTDPLGAQVPNARVTLSGGGQSRDTSSNNDGGFSFANVAPGLYQVVVAVDGFQPYTSEPMYVGAGATVHVRAALRVSPLQQAVVVTAAAQEISQAQTGAPITVIDSSTLEALNKPDVLEALRLVPGAQVVQTGARGGVTSFFIRGGASGFNKVLIDGSVANDIGGGFDFAQLSATGIERVEVLRQTNSVMYGSDALAGVVNVTTKRGRTQRPELTLALDGGNLGTWSSDVGIGGVARRFNYFSSYGRFETDNEVPNNDFRNGTYAGRFGVALGSNTDISATIRRTDTDAGNPNGITLYGLADDSRSKTKLTYASVSADSMLTNRWQSAVRFGTTSKETRYSNPTGTGEPYDPFGFGPSYLGRTVTLTGANGYSVTGRGILDFSSSSASQTHTTRNSLSGQTTVTVNNALSLSGGARFDHEAGISCFTAVDCIDSLADQQRKDQTNTRNNGGAFVEGRGTIANRHYISAGLGVEHNEVFGNAVTPRISVASYLRQPSAAGGGDTKIVLNAGTGIKAPGVGETQFSVYELLQGTPSAASFEPLGPERSRSFDVGVEQGFASNLARVRVAYFHNTFHDLIDFLDQSGLIRAGVPPAIANATSFGGYINSQSVRAQGAEISLDAALHDDLRVTASYTRLDAEVTKAFGASVINPQFPTTPIGQFSALVGARPFRRPANSGTFAVIYAPGRFQVALSAYFAGKRDDSTFVDDQFFGYSMLLPNKDLDAAYQKVDLSAAANVHPRVKVYTSIENLFDRKYEPSFGFPALPLTARAGVKVSLGGDR